MACTRRWWPGRRRRWWPTWCPPESRARGYGIYYTCVGRDPAAGQRRVRPAVPEAGPGAWPSATGAALALLAAALLPLSRVRPPPAGVIRSAVMAPGCRARPRVALALGVCLLGRPAADRRRPERRLRAGDRSAAGCRRAAAGPGRPAGSIGTAAAVARRQAAATARRRAVTLPTAASSPDATRRRHDADAPAALRRLHQLGPAAAHRAHPDRRPGRPVGHGRQLAQPGRAVRAQRPRSRRGVRA